MSDYILKWHQELDLFYRLKSLIIMEGNINDKFMYPGEYSMSLIDYLATYLHRKGYEYVVGYDHVKGFYIVGDNEKDESGKTKIEQFRSMNNIGTPVNSEGFIPVRFTTLNDEEEKKEEKFRDIIERVMLNKESRTAVILDMASRMVLSPDALNQKQSDSFARIVSAASKVELDYIDQGDEYLTIRNICFMLVEKANDLPVWVYKDNPAAKILQVQTPTREERMELVSGDSLGLFFDPDIYDAEIGKYEEEPKELEKLKERFVALTEGFTRRELDDLQNLCENEKFHINQLTSVIDLYKYGVKDNPWTTPQLRERLLDGRRILSERVKGQQNAMEKTLQVMKRAVSGLSGIQHSSHGKPKGILFFAGPTGTGKTEMAKSLAELIFGDERNCIRFDMSEYADPSSDQRLLGAAPGYVGYEAGGQLTNAVKEHPFSILLFDEIEKAHSSVMDKFLQILEDGRMTDGQGNTVYFSECVIIFTSNLGIYQVNPATQRRELVVSIEDNYEDVEKKVIDGINDYFKLQLGRPEILNRIGENIVVYDFIREDVARDIMEAQITKIKRNLLSENNVTLEVSEEAKEGIFAKVCTNLENGGRGVGNIIEELLVNPLSSYMLDNDFLSESSIIVEKVDSTVVPANVVINGRKNR